MEYIYAAMLLHKAGKKISEENVKKVLQGAGIGADEARVKALVTALEGVNIDEAVKKAAVAPAAIAAAPASAGEAPKGAKKEEKKEDDKKTEEAAAVGLGALFG